MKIKKGDTVLITSGKDRGKTGKILDVFKEEGRVVVEGVNLRKKHMRPKKGGEKGQTVEKPGAFSISNVKILCPKCGKPTRVGFKVMGQKKQRICKKCQGEI